MKSDLTSRALSFPRSLKALPFIAALATGVSVSLPARASESFPAYLDEKYQMPCVPACTLCHLSNEGGATMLRPGFVENLIIASNNTLEAGVPESMDTALATIESMGMDRDMDGDNDIDELRAGTDPGGGAPLCNVPKYGCGASVAPSYPTRFGALALAASVMLMLGLRRRR